jgi:hypothetical protein
MTISNQYREEELKVELADVRAGYNEVCSQLTARKAELLGLKCTIRKMLDYRRRNTLNFQLEKLDDYLKELQRALETE